MLVPLAGLVSRVRCSGLVLSSRIAALMFVVLAPVLGAQMGSPLELRLYPEALLTGIVLATDRTPLPRIPVTAQRSFWDDSGHRWVTVGQDQTDSHGNFRLPEPAGEYRLESRYTPLD